jgi:drug/metabolite transporter (DMT)-like permease
MKIQDQTKGYLFAFLAVLATSNVFIFSKAALNDISLAAFGFYWFLFGLLWNLLYSGKRGKLKQIKTFEKKQFLVLGVLGLLEIIGTTFFFLSIHTVPNPAIVSFLGNINPLIVTILGFIIMKDRYNRPEILGIALVLLGAFIISYKGGGQLSSMFIKGADYVLYAGIFFGFSAIITKRNVQKISPSILALSRNVFLFSFSFIMLAIQGMNMQVGWYALWNMFIGSILGPFLTVTAGYQAYKYIEVSRVSILGSTKGIFVMIGAFIYFGKFPETIQLIGGLISILGVILISVGKLLLKKKESS